MTAFLPTAIPLSVANVFILGLDFIPVNSLCLSQSRLIGCNDHISMFFVLAFFRPHLSLPSLSLGIGVRGEVKKGS